MYQSSRVSLPLWEFSGDDLELLRQEPEEVASSNSFSEARAPTSWLASTLHATENSISLRPPLPDSSDIGEPGGKATEIPIIPISTEHFSRS